MTDEREERWAEFGRDQAQYRLEMIGDSLSGAFRHCERKLERGEELDESDIKAVYDALDEATLFLDGFAQLVPGSRVPALWECLSEEEQDRIRDRLTTRET